MYLREPELEENAKRAWLNHLRAQPIRIYGQEGSLSFSEDMAWSYRSKPPRQEEDLAPLPHMTNAVMLPRAGQGKEVLQQAQLFQQALRIVPDVITHFPIPYAAG
jgi:hypothetical protein